MSSNKIYQDESARGKRSSLPSLLFYRSDFAAVQIQLCSLNPDPDSNYCFSCRAGREDKIFSYGFNRKAKDVGSVPESIFGSENPFLLELSIFLFNYVFSTLGR